MSECPMKPDELREIAFINFKSLLGMPLNSTAIRLKELAKWIQELEQQKSPWVSVEERLPDKEEAYLVCVNGVLGLGYDVIEFEDGEWEQKDESPVIAYRSFEAYDPPLPESEAE